MKATLVLLVIAACIALTATHTYHLGACPMVQPEPAFQMSRFLGLWYAIQKTSTSSKCLTYNFTLTGEQREYNLEQVSVHPILGIAKSDKTFHQTGKLKASPEVPARMTVKFSYNFVGSASFTVFMTDYDTYAGIYTCQQLVGSHRRSATILSRNKTLDQASIDKMRSRLLNFEINLQDLSIIDHTACPEEKKDSDTTTPNFIDELNEMF